GSRRAWRPACARRRRRRGTAPAPARDSRGPPPTHTDARRKARGSPRCRETASQMILGLTVFGGFASVPECAAAHDEIPVLAAPVLADGGFVRLPARKLASRGQR